MKRTQKNPISKIFSRCRKSLAIMFVAISGIFLVACSATSSSYEADFDAEGRYRLGAVTLTYYDKTSDGSQNEFTGSFLLPMEFYRDEIYSKQVSDSKGNEAEFYRNFDQTGITPFWNTNSSNGILSLNDLVFPDYTFWISGHIYQLHVSVDIRNLEICTTTENIATGAIAYYGNNNYVRLKAGATLEGTFRFSYRSGTSGEWRDADGFAKAVYMSKSSDNKIDVTTSSDSEASYDKVFYLCFNPMLENGSTSRKIRVKAVPNLGMNIDTSAKYDVLNNKYDDSFLTKSLKYTNRGDSLYSNTVSFNAYKLSFSAYSPNSAFLDYGELSYEANEFYFYNTQSTYSTTAKKYYLTTISGYFPEGRVVKVTRNIEDHVGTNAGKGTEYALSSWSSNSKGINSLAIPSSLPSADYFPFANKYGQLEDFDKGYHSLIGNTSEKRFAIKSYLSSENVYPYYTNNGKTGSTHFEILNYGESDSYYSYDEFGNQIATGNYRSGTIYIGSCQEYSGYTFYANFVRVDNFTIAGTIFDSEKILNFENSKLKDVGYEVYNINNEKYDDKQGLFTDYAFSISGLHYGDYIILYRNELVDGVEVQYRFYGTDLSTLNLDGTDVEKILSNTVNTKARILGTRITYGTFEVYLGKDENSFINGTTIYYVEDGKVVDIHGNVYDSFKVETIYNTLDLSNISVLATKYDNDSSVVLNFYVLKDGELQDPTENGISYEVIKSVNSYVDAFGCVTTTVYVSVVLPADASLQGYNVVTNNSKATNVYVNENDPIFGNKILAVNKNEKGVNVASFYLMWNTQIENTNESVSLSTNGNQLTYTDKNGNKRIFCIFI